MRKSLLVAACGLMLAGVAACHQEGPAEKAGASLDNAGQKVQDTPDPPQGPARAAGRPSAWELIVGLGVVFRLGGDPLGTMVCPPPKRVASANGQGPRLDSRVNSPRHTVSSGGKLSRATCHSTSDATS
jgi:hypothetical protein